MYRKAVELKHGRARIIVPRRQVVPTSLFVVMRAAEHVEQCTPHLRGYAKRARVIALSYQLPATANHAIDGAGKATRSTVWDAPRPCAFLPRSGTRTLAAHSVCSDQSADCETCEALPWLPSSD